MARNETTAIVLTPKFSTLCLNRTKRADVALKSALIAVKLRTVYLQEAGSVKGHSRLMTSALLRAHWRELWVFALSHGFADLLCLNTKEAGGVHLLPHISEHFFFLEITKLLCTDGRTANLIVLFCSVDDKRALFCDKSLSKDNATILALTLDAGFGILAFGKGFRRSCSLISIIIETRDELLTGR